MSTFTSKRLALTLAATAALLAPGSALAAPKEAGIWYDDTGKGAVKIEACGNKLCGKIYWLKDQLNAEGKPLRDKYNPNEGQRNRPICGLQVIGGLTLMETGEWDSGWIYDPKEGKSYSVALIMPDPNTLKVTGYLVMKMMGRTLTWTRAPNDLPPCAQNAAATSPAAVAPAAKPKPSKVGAAPEPEDDVNGQAPSAASTQAPNEETAAPTVEAVTPKADTKAKAATETNAKAGTKAKTAVKPAQAPADKSSKSAAKPAASKAKTTAEVLPWADTKNAPAAAPAATAPPITGAQPGAEDAAPAKRQAAPDMQATFGAQ